MAAQLVPLLLSAGLLLRRAAASAAVQCYSGEGGFTAELWPHCQAINDDVLVYYGVSSDSDYLMLGMHAAGHSGWSALALAGNGGMKGASMAVVRKVDGVFVAEDRYSEAYDTPGMDDSQDILLMFASEEFGGTSWGVLMPANSCDEQDYPIGNYTRTMLWALGTGHDFDQSTFHGMNRGQFKANLINGPPAVPEIGEVDEIDMLMNDVPVVAGDGGDDKNPFICHVFDMRVLINETLGVPAGDVDSMLFHAVKFSAVIDAISKPFVHHMVLYGCEQQEYFTHGHVIESCEVMPWGCNQMVYAWGLGGEDIVLPDGVGLPFTTNTQQGGTPWLTLQVHYYNPNLVSGIRASSGVRISLAKQLRPTHAGFLTFEAAVNPTKSDPIPPGQPNFELDPWVVSADCTEQFPEEGINVIGVAHHQHLIGTRMNIDLFRDGRNLGPMRLERMYDFNHQSLDEPAIRKVLPRDQFLVTCSYDSSAQTQPTPFGPLTTMEMCFGVMLYWPLQLVTKFVNTTTDRDGREDVLVTWCDGTVGTHVEPEPINDTARTCDAAGDVTSSAAASLAQAARAVWEDLANAAAVPGRGAAPLAAAALLLGLAAPLARG